MFRLAARGYTNGKIADLLFISPRTAERHRFNIGQKLGLRNTADLVRYAVKLGVINPDHLRFP